MANNMTKDFMSIQEAATMAVNLEALETVYGGPVPGYMIDPDEVSQDFLSVGELGTMAANIDIAEAVRGRVNSSSVQSAADARSKVTIVFGIALVALMLIAHFL